MEPVSLGKYTLLSRLAWGGMAELFLARANEPSRADEVLVVKLVARRFAEDQAFVNMFQDEAKIAALLDHPQIGRVTDVGEHGGRHYLVMEYLHGKDLRSICRRSLDLQRGGLPFDVAVRIGIKVCSALHFAHAARGADGALLNIIHRDVSPSNVMLTFDGRVKLVDFGIAKAANRATLTQPGLIKGKLRYLSPEQILGLSIDHRCDIFIFGTTLWECTLGRHLFEGNDEALIYQAIREGRVPPPSSILPGYPPRLEAVLMRALAKERGERFATASEMQVALEGVAAALGVDTGRDQQVLSSYLGELFREELDRWQLARQGGRSLADHIVFTTPPARDDAEPDIDVKPRRLPAQPRRTLYYGEPPSTASGTVDQAAPPSREIEQIPLRSFTPSGAVPVVSASAVAGQVVGGTAEPVESANSGRPTMLDPDQLPTMPVIPDDGGPMGVPPRPRPVVEALQPTLPPGSLPPPVADEARVVLGEDPELVPGPQPLKTGDWAHQQLAGQGMARPGTHPMFKDEPEPLAGVSSPVAAAADGAAAAGSAAAERPPVTNSDLSHLVPHRFGGPKLLIAVLVGVTLTVVALLALWLIFGREPPPAGVSSAPSPPTPQDRRSAPRRGSEAFAAAPADAGQADGATVRLTTEPAGATAYNAGNGQVLGKTPLTVDRSRLGATSLELRLPGYRSRRVELDRQARLHVVLKRAAVGPARGPSRRRGAKQRRRPGPGLDDDLVNPFGK